MSSNKEKKGKNFWGDPFWKTIHCICASYRPECALAAKTHMYTYTELLPCAECRIEFKKNLTKFPIDSYLGNNHELFFWSYLVHDAVNTYHNIHHPNEIKKISPPYDEIKAYFFKALSDECKDCRVL